MKKRICLVIAVCFLISLLPAYAQEYGKIRAMKERAVRVTTMKNDFTSRVLSSYDIPHERNAEGAVVRLNMDGRWLGIHAIEIVPVTKDVPEGHQVTGHELFFFTDEGILELISDLKAR